MSDADTPTGDTATGPPRAAWLAVAAAAAAAAGAAWTWQHRVVGHAVADTTDLAAAGLVVPDDLTHHDITAADGGTIHVVERGAGPPLVLIHGVTLSHELWVHQFTDLADRYRVIAIDQRGHGRSTAGADGFTAPGTHPGGIRRLAADLATVLDTLDLDHAVLVGHSMGGMTTLQWAADSDPARRRRQVAGVALVSTLAGPMVGLPGWSKLLALTTPAAARALRTAERTGADQIPARDLRYWTSRFTFGADAPPAEVRFAERMISATAASTLSLIHI